MAWISPPQIFLECVFQAQAHLGDIVDSVPDNHNKADTAVTAGHRIVCFSVLVKVLCMLYSIQCAVALCLRKECT